LAQLLVSIMSDLHLLNQLTHDSPRDGCKTEIEVSMEPAVKGRELVAKAVVDITADDKTPFDKSKFTKFIKASAACSEWPKLRIVKKAVLDQ